MIVPYLNVYFEDRFHASKTSIGIIVALGQGATAVAFLIGPLLARKFGEVISVLIVQFGSIPFLLITAFTTNIYLASGGFLFRQALMNAASPFMNTIKMRYTDLCAVSPQAQERLRSIWAGFWLLQSVQAWLCIMAPIWATPTLLAMAVGYILITVLFYLFFGKNRFKAVEENKHPVVSK
jgi:hypothetical protein